jgi:hypothetical protein
MTEVWLSISSGTTNDTSADCRGCVDVPLRNCVPIKAYIIPIIHTEIGIGNRLLKSFHDWVDLWIERVPRDEIDARYAVYEANTELRIQNERWDEWVSLKGALLADLRQERAMINYTNTLRDDEGQFAHSAAEQKEMAEASKARTAEVKPMEKEKKDVLSELESFKKVLVARTKAFNQLRQKRHRGDSPIKNGLEKLLAILGIDRAAYHGGDLNGKNVQQMF